MSKKVTSTLAGAFLFLIVVNLLSKGLGFFREVLFANFFGRGVEFDIYLIGAVIPIIINTVVLYIGQNYFIPGYHKIKSDNSNLTYKFFAVNFIVFIIIGTIISVILYFLSETIITAYLHTADESIKEIAIDIFRLFLITIPLMFAISILTAYEQAEFRFKYPAIAGLFLNLAMIPILLIFTSMFGIYTIPIGFILGTFFQFIYLSFKVSSRISFESFSFVSKKELFGFFDSTILSVILIESIGQIYLLSDRYFFASVDQGGLSALSYSFILFSLPIAVVSLALTTIIFPKFSEIINSKSFEKLQEIFSDSIRVNLLFFVPIAFLFFYYGDTILKLVFERGKFTGTDTLDTFITLKVYTISLIFYSAYSILNKVFYSAKFVNYLLIITICGIAIKIFLNFFLVGIWQQNGLALSTSFSFIFIFFASFILIHKILPLNNSGLFIKELTFQLVNGFISYFIVEVILNSVNTHNILIDIIKIILYLFVFLLNTFIMGNKSLVIIKKLFSTMRTAKSI